MRVKITTEHSQSALRDQLRRPPFDKVELFSQSGLSGITIPHAFGGAEMSNEHLADVIVTISAADPSLGQIPQNHDCLIEDIRLEGSPEQQRYFFERVLRGKRYGNAFSEAGDKNVLDLQTTIPRDGDEFILNGRKFYATGALFAHWVPVLARD